MQELLRRIFSGYSFLAFFIIAFLNPILNYVFIGNISLHSLVLIPFLIISLFLLKFNEKYYQIGIITSLVFLIICYLIPNRRNDLLFVFINLTFFSNALISEKYLVQLNNDKILNLLFLIIIAGIIHSFGLAYGLLGNPDLTQELIGKRIGRSNDISEMIPFTIPFLFFYAKSRSHLLLKLLAYSSIVLGILRLIATGTRGITVSVLLSVVLYILFFHISLKRLKFTNIIGALILIISVVIISRTFIAEQVSYLTNQYIVYNLGRGEDTGIARIDEANKDFNTFLDNPIMGGGFNDAMGNFNSLKETSAGHFFFTGMLARVGIVGTLFFLLAYIFFFIKMYRQLKFTKTGRYFFLSTIIIVITYFILGNPLYLSMVWPVLPVFWGIIVNYSKNEKHSHSVL